MKKGARQVILFVTSPMNMNILLRFVIVEVIGAG